MKVELRNPNKIMKLSRLGSFHQSKLSFLRSFLNEFKEWEYKRDLFELNKNGYGEAVYSFTKNKPGFPKQPNWFEDARGFKNLEVGLKKVGFSETETNGILGNNWYNFYKTI